MYARLQANYADYPDIIPIRTAVHASEHSLPIYRVAPTAIRRYDAWATGIGSFDREHLIRHGIATEDILGELVQCIPLMTLLQQTGTLDADLLQVDAEGYDAAIVLMIDFEAFRPRIIKYEHKNMTPQEREQVLAKLTSNSYLTASEGTDTIAWQAA
jgi:hypothetical protein